MSSSRTHRCIECAPTVEHLVEELCPSCGRCEIHCHQDNHLKMQRAEFRSIGEGEAARMELVPPDRAKQLPAASSRRSRDA